MSKITHPYFLLFIALAASAFISFPIAERRAHLAEIRRQQEIMLSEIIKTNDQTIYLTRKRRELLTNPATIAEVAKENYGFVWKGRLSKAARNQEIAEPQRKKSVKLAASGTDKFLGTGEYLWQIPILITALTAAVFALSGILEKLLPKVIAYVKS